MSRNFELLQKIGKEQEIFQTELDPQSVLQAPVAAQKPLSLGGIKLGPASSSASGLNALPQAGQRNKVASQPNPKSEQLVMSCDLCHECGLSVPENRLFCPKCGAFQGPIATDDHDSFMPQLPQRAPSFVGRLAVWLQVLRRRAAAGSCDSGRPAVFCRAPHSAAAGSPLEYG